MRIKKLVSVILTVSIAASLTFGCGTSLGSVDNQAAIREFDPDEVGTYLVDERIPMSDSANSGELKAMAKDCFEQVNEKRAASGMSEFAWNDALEEAAEVRATEIVDVFSHTRPDGTPWWTVDGNSVYGENLAKGYDTADAIVAGWVSSPTHNANLMDKSFASMSIAVYKSGDTYYVAQEFGY